MTWVSVFTAIYDQLEADLKALNNGGSPPIPTFTAVYRGRKIAPTEFPCAFIFPLKFRPSVAAAESSFFKIPFEIRVVSSEASATTGFADALSRLGIVQDHLVKDRRFHTLVMNLEVDQIEPEIEKPRVRDRHEAALVVTFHTVITEV